MGFWNLLWNWFCGCSGGPASTPPLEERRSADAVLGTLTLGDEAAEPVANDESRDRWWKATDDALLEIPPLIRTDRPAEVAALQRILAAYLQGADLRLPSLPKAAERVLRLLGQQQYDAGRIGNAIANDQVLAAALLRLANSALYAGRERITVLRVAVARIGTHALRSLIMQYSLQAALLPRVRGDRLLTDIVWNGSLASATIMRGLAGGVGADPEESHLIGLLHDIGSVLVLREVQEQQSVLRYKMDLESFDWLCREYHAPLGKLIGEAWDLPGKVKALIAGYDGPVAPDDPLARERHMLVLTDMIKAMLGYAMRRPYALMEATSAKALDLAGTPAFAAFLDRLPMRLRGIPTTF